jgi:hypothetical protein
VGIEADDRRHEDHARREGSVMDADGDMIASVALLVEAIGLTPTRFAVCFTR